MNDYEKAMQALTAIPGVTEYLDSFAARLGREIFNLRLQKGLTQRELALLAQVTQTTVSKIESGNPGIKGETYNKVLIALGEEYNFRFADKELVSNA